MSTKPPASDSEFVQAHVALAWSVNDPKESPRTAALAIEAEVRRIARAEAYLLLRKYDLIPHDLSEFGEQP